MDVGLGYSPAPANPSQTAMRPLAFWLRDGPLAAEMCRVHNTVVQGWKADGPEALRVATLLGWTVRTDWRNAPEVLWFRHEQDLAAWADFLRRALPLAIQWLERARVDGSQPALRLFIDE